MEFERRRDDEESDIAGRVSCSLPLEDAATERVNENDKMGRVVGVVWHLQELQALIAQCGPWC